MRFIGNDIVGGEDIVSFDFHWVVEHVAALKMSQDFPSVRYLNL